LPRLVWAAALVLSGALPASAQQTEDLQQQLLELKKQYEETTQQLLARITALEQQIQAEFVRRVDRRIDFAVQR
jgi:hypothetical protein